MTTTTQPNPGDWKYLPNSNMIGAASKWSDAGGHYCDYRFPVVVAYLPDDWDQHTKGPLIAAAPDLLKVARMALVALERSEKERGVRHLETVAIRAAIAKAEGRAS